jgi:hypothetical protein
MYTTNRFDFTHDSGLAIFAQRVRPQRLAVVRELNIRYFHDLRAQSYDEWHDTILILRGLEGLRSLKMEISTQKPAPGDSSNTVMPDEPMLLSPLADFNHVEDFVVEVNWPVQLDRETNKAYSWPFKVRRLTHR